MISYITIPEPCHKDWQQMTPNEQGRHCAHCCKTVIDFSAWEPEEIVYYLRARKEEQVCGRFRKAQLDTPILTPEAFVWQLDQTPLSFLKRVAAIFLFVFGVMSTACNTPQPKPHTPVTQTTPAPSDTAAPMMTGDTSTVSIPLDRIADPASPSAACGETPSVAGGIMFVETPEPMPPFIGPLPDSTMYQPLPTLPLPE
jgi:hypothetical protein